MLHSETQTRPTDSNRALFSTSFKSALIDFLAFDIRSQHYKDIINGETVFFGWKQSCIKVQVDNIEVIISGVNELSCSHNEADTRILWHARYAAENTSNPMLFVQVTLAFLFPSFTLLLCEMLRYGWTLAAVH